ncbi:MAG: ComF family protein [Prevotella sp.]|nr:ComF family protein [Prevotella sp.]
MMTISFWRRLLDIVMPRTCAICGRRLTPSESIICASCLTELPFTRQWLSADDNHMARLFWGVFPIERAAALWYYAPHSESSNPIYNLKYHGSQETGVELGMMAANYYSTAGFFDGIDAIVPVPLAPKRQRQRGYNQSLMIAKGVQSVTGLPIYNKVVRRTHFKGSQTQKNTWQRQENVADVFMLTDAATITGKHLLIVDDVVTTGATVSACAQQLCRASDVRISVLALGFTVH